MKNTEAFSYQMRTGAFTSNIILYLWEIMKIVLPINGFFMSFYSPILKVRIKINAPKFIYYTGHFFCCCPDLPDLKYTCWEF